MKLIFTNSDIGLTLFLILVVLVAIFMYLSYRDVLKR